MFLLDWADFYTRAGITFTSGLRRSEKRDGDGWMTAGWRREGATASVTRSACLRHRRLAGERWKGGHISRFLNEAKLPHTHGQTYAPLLPSSTIPPFLGRLSFGTLAEIHLNKVNIESVVGKKRFSGSWLSGGPEVAPEGGASVTMATSFCCWDKRSSSKHPNALASHRDITSVNSSFL